MQPNFCGFTALHLATQQGHNQSARELLYAGCLTTIQNDYGDTCMHTAVRYGHAGVLRILISAKCDVDAFNHNHDTPLHLACALGKRKLTKLLIEAGAMQFRNNQHETARDIAKRKNLQEILEIIDAQADKLDRKLIRESLRKSKTSSKHQCLPHDNSKNKHGDVLSPYGCHFYPDTRNFPRPKLQTLPKDPLKTGEIYYLDLAGSIRKGPIGASRCSCFPYSNEAMVEHCKNIQKYVDKANEKLNRKICELTTKIEKNERKQHENHREGSRERNLDPLYPLLKVVGDKNKQIHLESWLCKVHPEAGLQSPHSSENVKEVAADIHLEPRSKARESIKVSRNSSSRKLMPQYDEQMLNDSKSKGSANEMDDENDDSYTDISGEEDDNGIDEESNSDNPLYDEAFMRNFQQQQFAQHSNQNESLTSPSINSNQNIEMEMERIAKSLLANEDELMVSSRNPDVIRDHIQASAKRSTKKIKSAIVTKPGDLYVNSFFNHNENNGGGGGGDDDGGGRSHFHYYSHSQSDIDEVDSCEIDQLVSKVQQTILNSNSIVDDLASSTDINGNPKPSSSSSMWSHHAGRSRNRNPLPMNFTDEIENYAHSIFRTDDDDPVEQVQTTLNENNFVLLDKLLKARKHLNQNYHHQQLQMMSGSNNSTIDDNQNSNGDFSHIPSSSLV